MRKHIKTERLNFKDIIIMSISCVFLYIAITSSIQRFKCAELTETELFIMIPQSFLLDFKTC